ncbi:efflux RND transporter periplasmic adaptor subunit [Vibrio parahaemolyticus]|nr:efflux transporter periplasmic adaptor subunit [Vibrio parahaemolyticus]TBT66928.1 efflux RND transporter periplasmic adaptor subunit [Vibrio parahaemolyticus]TOG71045.1 efflux RND transporter periplasmic adaptor subunit [Vibrio parahaemolyticus]TOQ40092.1 efflux RND transporter periplasmic adaptor subunit [Vibrio parahaemolyticus]TOQ59853.1 efflux RND transporter periplasmic adaptor subunit [Vibrio parahaemolyticus]
MNYKMAPKLWSHLMNHQIKTAALSTIALSLLGCNQAQPQVEEPSASRPVQVIEVNERNEELNKSFSGIVKAKETASLSFRVPGTVESVFVNKGSVVEKGQVIATLDKHDYQVSLEELQARMLEAQSAHKLAKAELKRVKQATSDDAIASVNLDRAISSYERSLSAVKVVEKNIQRAKDALRYTTLRAPFTGIVADVSVDPHEQTLPGGSVVSIQQEGSWEVDIDVPENMIAQFALGQPASLTWYDSKQSYRATVAEIAPKKHLLKQTYTVTLDIDSISSALFNGKAVTVNTALNTSHSSHCFPYSAILGEKQTLHVNVVRDAVIHSEPVNLDSIDAYQACVTGSFEQGDYVVISGSHYLSEGDAAPNLTIKTL